MVNSVFRLNLKDQYWEKMPDMRIKRTQATAIVMNNKIYVFGGYAGHSNKPTEIETFSDEDKSWTRIKLYLPFGIESACYIERAPGEILMFGGRLWQGDSDDVNLFILNQQANN